MKKIVLLLCCFSYTFNAWSQTDLMVPFKPIWESFKNNQQDAADGIEKVMDSIVLQRIDSTLQLSLETKNIFLYDSLARETRSFSSFFDINGDSLFYTDQTNTTYPLNQIVASRGRIEQNQYRNTDRSTETFDSEGLLLSRLGERWEEGNNTFINNNLLTNYFLDGSALVDSIITQTWDASTQEWVLNRLDLQFFNGDELRDSVYNYQWDTSANLWRLTGKFTSSYDALGQLTNLNIYNWDTSINGFNLQLEIFEFYNGDALKDSAHVYSYFGGYYGETATSFTYDNDLVIADTVYIWDEVSGQLNLVNYQSYSYDTEGDIVEQKTFSYDALTDLYTQITQINYYYSIIETPSVSVEQVAFDLANCYFANPYPLGSAIRCELQEPVAKLRARVYNAAGQLILEEHLSKEKSLDFSLPNTLKPGIYFLSLETPQRQLGRYKLYIAPR